ncbi:MAG: hypothetical protein K6F33_06655 [Bacteroidales bacterium]|nr:hypothetical protein [Bacteroidales bacterium]
MITDNINSDVFFPVLDRDTFFEFNGQTYPCVNYHTIVRGTDLSLVYSVPRRSWVLITYKESVDAADILAKKLFDKSSLLDVEHEYSVGDGAECIMKFWEEDYFEAANGFDRWLPQVCISNNYNCTGALLYDFGFQVRGLESNIIFDDLNINLNVKHTSKGKKNIAENLEKKLDAIEFQNKNEFIKKFLKKIKKLMNQSLGAEEIFPLVLKFLDADIKAKSRKTTKDAYVAIRNEIFSIFQRNSKLDLYIFMKEMSYFIETTSTLANLKEEEKDDDEEEEVIGGVTISFYPNQLSYRMKLKMQKKLGAFVNRIIKEAIEHKDDSGEIDPMLLSDWIGEKYFKMETFLMFGV